MAEFNQDAQRVGEAPIRVLLIEDDPEDRFLIERMVGQPGWPGAFAIRWAEDLGSGLAVLGEGRPGAPDYPEIILLDFMLPDSSGMETVRAVRRRAPTMPIIVLTGVNDEAMGLEAVINGAQDFMRKGMFDSLTIKRTLRFAVERHRLSAQFHQLIQKAADGMVVVDSQGLVQYVNPAAEAIFGKSKEELLGRLFAYDLKNGASATQLKIQAGEKERVVEARLVEIEWKARPARLASIRDITDLRRIEQLKAEVQERRRMDKLKDELMSIVSHEIRNPLTIIKAAVSNLNEGLAGPLKPRQEELVWVEMRNVARLEKIVNHILDLSRLESGRAQINPEAFDPAALIREVVAGFRLVVRDRRIKIHAELPTGLGNGYADPSLVTQVVSNLLDNAVRFARETVTVAVRGRGQDIVISVQDDGPGIPPDRQGDLFSKFMQVNRRLKGQTYQGTGLGLAICREIVERQGGKIWFESPREGGTRFLFAVPARAPAALAAGPQEER